MPRILLVSLLMAVTILPVSRAQDNATALPAKFLFSLGQSGSSLEFLQPQQIRCDQQHQEFYICDTGHDRIVILDARGFYVFEFSHPDVMRAPTDVAVDSEGHIYVLGSAVPGSPLLVFDYNGDYLRPFTFHGGPEPASFDVGSLVMDSAQRLLLLDSRAGRVLCFDLSGNFQYEFPLFPKADARRDRDLILGKMALSGEQLLIPAPMEGSVFCFDTRGSLLKMVGHRGGGYGELSFPVAVSGDAAGNVLVLDKHRCLIVSYNKSGLANGEIGGMGTDPGWFYHPTALLVDAHQRVWVAQGLNNLIQVLQLPEPAPPAPPKPDVIVVDD